MDPFDSFTRIAESNRGNYDPFAAVNNAAGMAPMSAGNNCQSTQPDQQWPLIRVKIPGERDIVVRALPLGTSPSMLQWDISVNIKDSVTATIAPGTIAGFLPTNMMSPLSMSDATSTWYFWVDCAISGGAITSVTIDCDTQPPVPQTVNAGAPPGELKILFGFYDGATGTSYNTLGVNWVVPYPVIAFTTGIGVTSVNNYIWKW